MIGCVPHNFHEGTRSEYLVQAALSGFGTAALVPHQEDVGVDLHCTLTECVGQRAWSRLSYAVQVKSTLEPWVFDGPLSVRWLIENPSPLLLCVVDKASSRIKLFHTGPRFGLWSYPPLPDRVELVPQSEGRGIPSEWRDGERCSLGPPIMSFSLADVENEYARARLKTLLGCWLEFDRRNLIRIQTGERRFVAPAFYTSNEEPQGIQSSAGFRIDSEHLQGGMSTLNALAGWLSWQLATKGDLPGAARIALMLDYLLGSEASFFVAGTHMQLTQALCGDDEQRLYAGVEKLTDAIDAILPATVCRTSAIGHRMYDPRRRAGKLEP